MLDSHSRRDRRHPLLPLAAGALTALLTSATASAIPERASAPPMTRSMTQPSAPTFAIETVVVEGLRHATPELIVAESRLIEGGRYSEAELRDAVHRIRRLPFVLDARPALRRGSAPGNYQLTLEVEEARSFFFGQDLSLTAAGDALALDRGRPDETWLRSAPVVGGRFFLGRYDMVFASASGEGGVQLGYQRHGLLGRGGVLRVTVGRTGCCPTRIFDLGLDPGFDAWREEDGAVEASAELGLPLVGNHALRLHLGHRSADGGFHRDAVPGPGTAMVAGPVPGASAVADRFVRFAFDTLERQTLELAWHYVTTDDPTFPSRGVALSAGVDGASLEATGVRVAVVSEGVAAGPETALPPTRARQLRASVGAERHWPLAGGHAASLAVRGALGRGRVENLSLAAGARTLAELAAVQDVADFTVWSAGVSAGYSRDLRSAVGMRRWGDVRWQTRLSWSRDGTSLALPGFTDLETVELETGITLRNAWGLVRVLFRLIEIRDL